MTTPLGYGIFDSDQHYYETRDSFTRHIEPKFRDMAIQPAWHNGIEKIRCGDTFSPHDSPIFDVAARPGSLRELLKGFKTGVGAEHSYEFEPMRDEYFDRDKRLKLMDEQGVDATFMFCNNAIIAQELSPNPEVLFANLRSFNKWQEEEWGYSYQNRIFCPAMLSLEDLPLALDLLDTVIANGAKAIAMIPGPCGGRAPGDPYFDPFWSKVNEAGLILGYHIAPSGFVKRRSAEWGLDPTPSFYHQSAFQWMFMYGDQPIQETLTTLIFDNFFARFPNIKVVTAEWGIEWAPLLCRKLDKYKGMGRNGPWIGGQLTERPSDTFKNHVRMHPFWEDDIETVVAALGPDVIIGGSDFPHSEGLADPYKLIDHLGGLDGSTQKAIMRDNGMALVGLG